MIRRMDDEIDGWNDASRRPLLYVIVIVSLGGYKFERTKLKGTYVI